MEDMSDFANPISDMGRIKDLHNELIVNCNELDELTKQIEAKPEDVEDLEELFQLEFMLYMDHIGIYHDLMHYLDVVEKTADNEFELARIKRDLAKLVRVEVVEL